MATESNTPVCNGPFGDARECPVHAPAIRARADEQQRQAIAEAEQRGAATVLREIAKLKNAPYKDGFYCMFCGANAAMKLVVPGNGGHYDNCLWPRAKAAVRATEAAKEPE